MSFVHFYIKKRWFKKMFIPYIIFCIIGWAPSKFVCVLSYHTSINSQFLGRNHVYITIICNISLPGEIVEQREKEKDQFEFHSGCSFYWQVYWQTDIALFFIGIGCVSGSKICIKWSKVLRLLMVAYGETL